MRQKVERPQARTVSNTFVSSQEARVLEQRDYGIIWEKQLTGHKKAWGFALVR